MLAIVAEDPATADEGAPTRWHSHFLLVSDGFVVRCRAEVDEAQLRELGAHVVELCTGRRAELSFKTQGGQLYLWLARKARGEVAVAGHLVRDEDGLLSSFQTRTDAPSLESFGDALRSFPYA